MAVKLATTKKPKFGIDAFLPTLITFGPIFMWMGLQNDVMLLRFQYGIHSPLKSPDWLNYGEAVVGTLMLAAGLALLKIKQDHIEKRLDELERLKN